MGKKNIAIIAGIVIVIVALVIFTIFNLLKKDKQEDVPYNVTSLNELFPSDEITQTYTDVNEEYEVSVKDITEKDGVTTIISEYETKTDDTVTTVQTTYEITSDKVIESGKYTNEGEVVSIIYPTELIVGMPYVNMTWKSADGLITNKVVSMINNQVTIESVRVIDIYEDGETSATKKDYKETRVYEKGKGIVLYRTEIVGDETSVYEKKIS